VADVRIVAKAMDDLADDWHWVLLRDAQELEPRLYHAQQVGTACGLLISSTPQQVRLFDMGAPSEPTCPRCLEDGGGAALREAEAIAALA
jgi:hypothetical protein